MGVRVCNSAQLAPQNIMFLRSSSKCFVVRNTRVLEELRSVENHVRPTTQFEASYRSIAETKSLSYNEEVGASAG